MMHIPLNNSLCSSWKAECERRTSLCQPIMKVRRQLVKVVNSLGLTTLPDATPLSVARVRAAVMVQTSSYAAFKFPSPGTIILRKRTISQSQPTENLRENVKDSRNERDHWKLLGLFLTNNRLPVHSDVVRFPRMVRLSFQHLKLTLQQWLTGRTVQQFHLPSHYLSRLPLD
mgnify:CR=1 FL=1